MRCTEQDLPALEKSCERCAKFLSQAAVLSDVEYTDRLLSTTLADADGVVDQGPPAADRRPEGRAVKALRA